MQNAANNRIAFGRIDMNIPRHKFQLGLIEMHSNLMLAEAARQGDKETRRLGDRLFLIWSAALIRRFCFFLFSCSRKKRKAKNKSGGKAPHSKLEKSVS